MQCFAFSAPQLYKVDKIAEFFQAEGHQVTWYDTAIHVEQEVQDSDEPPRDLFFFPYGATVGWGFELSAFERELDKVARFWGDNVGSSATDTHEYRYGEKASVQYDLITLPDNLPKTKLSVSHALAQSVKLQGFEKTIERTIEVTRDIPNYLAKKGKILLSRHTIRRMMGRLFMDKNSINLHLDLLTTPRFFWNHAKLEKLYEMTADSLDKERRVHVLNLRLDVLQELFDMLGVELNHQHSALLELIIILLIGFEIALTLAKEVFHLF